MSSPLKIQPDDVSCGGEETKDRDDVEFLRIFDGNSALKSQISRTASVAKTVTVQQILVCGCFLFCQNGRFQESALRRFHINDNPENFYVTQIISDGLFQFCRLHTESFADGDEDVLEDPVPLRNVKRPEGRRAQIFLRYKEDAAKDREQIRVYGGWLRMASVTYCSMEVSSNTTVSDVISKALIEFGLDGTTWNKYNLQQVCLPQSILLFSSFQVALDRGVADRTANPQECMLQLLRNLRKVSGIFTRLSATVRSRVL